MADLEGTSGTDFLFGSNDDDEIDGVGGNDLIFGFGGKDTILGGGGDDLVFAGGGGDDVQGGSGSDRLYGEGGDDVLEGGGNSNLIYGGPGNDTAVFHGVEGDFHVFTIPALSLGIVFDADFVNFDLLISVENIQFVEEDSSVVVPGDTRMAGAGSEGTTDPYEAVALDIGDVLDASLSIGGPVFNADPFMDYTCVVVEPVMSDHIDPCWGVFV